MISNSSFLLELTANGLFLLFLILSTRVSIFQLSQNDKWLSRTSFLIALVINAPPPSAITPFLLFKILRVIFFSISRIDISIEFLTLSKDMSFTNLFTMPMREIKIREM